jgi:hypothetical protein
MTQLEADRITIKVATWLLKDLDVGVKGLKAVVKGKFLERG